MKTFFITLLSLLIFQMDIHAQAKQRKELLLQIAALQVYIDYAKKGYAAVSKGLNFIGDLKKGEVDLHGDYFTSLVKINPKVKNYYKTGQIVSMQLKIIKIFRKTYSEIQGDDLFHGDELEYIQRTFERLLESCSTTLDDLLTVTTDSKLELKDDQRIERIDILHATMLEHYNFCLSFRNDIKQMESSKGQEIKESRQSSVLYGL